MILEFTLKNNKNPSVVYFLGTSSSKYSKQISEILGSKHNDCQRVEGLFSVKCTKQEKIVLGTTDEDALVTLPVDPEKRISLGVKNNDPITRIIQIYFQMEHIKKLSKKGKKLCFIDPQDDSLKWWKGNDS